MRNRLVVERGRGSNKDLAAEVEYEREGSCRGGIYAAAFAAFLYVLFSVVALVV